MRAGGEEREEGMAEGGGAEEESEGVEGCCQGEDGAGAVGEERHGVLLEVWLVGFTGGRGAGSDVL